LTSWPGDSETTQVRALLAWVLTLPVGVLLGTEIFTFGLNLALRPGSK
jgi:phosphate/sulfate permease